MPRDVDSAAALCIPKMALNHIGKGLDECGLQRGREPWQQPKQEYVNVRL